MVSICTIIILAAWLLIRLSRLLGRLSIAGIWTHSATTNSNTRTRTHNNANSTFKQHALFLSLFLPFHCWYNNDIVSRRVHLRHLSRKANGGKRKEERKMCEWISVTVSMDIYTIRTLIVYLHRENKWRPPRPFLYFSLSRAKTLSEE